MKRILTLLLLISCIAAGCRTKDVRDGVISVPGMKNQACAQIITEAIARQQGVLRETMEVDYAKREVKFRYDSMQLAMKNIEHAVAEAGFQANEIPAYEKARENLPPECK